VREERFTGRHQQFEDHVIRIRELEKALDLQRQGWDEALTGFQAEIEKRVEGLKFEKPFLHGQTSYAPIFNEAIDAALTAIKFSSSDINQER